MSIIVIGVNHKTAPVTLREKVYFSTDKLSLYLQDLLTRESAREAVLLSTCNRSELYCEADHIPKIRDWFCAQTTVTRHELESVLYIYQGEEAIAHIMHVACGLDSMVLGEPEILGQMKEAFSESCTAGTVGPLFQRLFQQIFSVAKEIRTSTSIGACPVSVASAAVHFTKQQVANFKEANVTLIGAGDTSQLLARYLQPQLSRPLSIVNRNVEKAQMLADQVGGRVYTMEALSHALHDADIVFSATGSAIPIVNKVLMQQTMQHRAHKTMTLIDIAVPRDIEESVKELEHVNLYCIDDLKCIIEKNRQGREHAADKGREMIYKRSKELLGELQSLDKVATTISAYRGQIEELCRAELMKAKHQLHQGADPTHVLEAFAIAFTQKLMHAPSVQLRQAGKEGRFELLRFAKQLFSLPDPETEML